MDEEQEEEQTSCGEGSKGGVKGNGIDRIHDVAAILHLAMALEGVSACLH